MVSHDIADLKILADVDTPAHDFTGGHWDLTKLWIHNHVMEARSQTNFLR